MDDADSPQNQGPAGGIVLMLMAVLAMLIANSPLDSLYNTLLETTIGVGTGDLSLEKTTLHWINDGLMAIFFLLVGMEIKREILEGSLQSRSQLGLPLIAATGGVTVPILIFFLFNWGDSLALKGWAIPAATDIAFALGMLALLGSRVPTSLKLFLATIAILDDLFAIVVIAFFFTSNLSFTYMALAVLVFLFMLLMNRNGVSYTMAYCLAGILLWILTLKSGVHATLAGVAMAITIPLHIKHKDGQSILRHLEHSLTPWVAFGILPLFALANAGVAIDNFSFAVLTKSISLGIILGLFLGKPLGVFLFFWMAVRFGKIEMPEGMNRLNLLGMAALCGIGFTMSLFMGTLAFEPGGEYAASFKPGILTGSLLSAVMGYTILRIALRRSSRQESTELQ